MILAATLLFAVGLGWASGGRLRNLRCVRLTGEGVLLGVLAVTVLIPMLAGELPMPAAVTRVVWLLAFAVIIIIATLNLRHVGLPAILLGSAMNLAAVVMNGAMPVSTEAMLIAGYPGNPSQAFVESLTHQSIDTSTRLAVASDVMPTVPVPGLQGVVSVGDVLLAAGVAAFVISGMVYCEASAKR
jgi:hypothetical protein